MPSPLGMPSPLAPPALGPTALPPHPAAGSASACRPLGAWPPNPATPVAGAAGRWEPHRADAPLGRCPARARRRRARERERERGRRPTRKARRTTEAGRSSWWWPEEEKKPCASSASPASRDLAGPAARDLAVPPTPLGHPPPALAKIRAGEGGDRGVDSAERGDEGAAAAIRFGPAGLLHGPVQERRRSVREGGLEADARCGRRCYSRAPRERQKEQAAAGDPPPSHAAEGGQIEEDEEQRTADGGSSVEEMVGEKADAGIQPATGRRGELRRAGTGMDHRAGGGLDGDEMEKRKWKFFKSALTVFCNFNSFSVSWIFWKQTL
ncbi:unnamed protein product [Urochloa humidicola]